jgi:hypothetical protein
MKRMCTFLLKFKDNKTTVFFLLDSGDVKAAGVMGNYVWHMQCVHITVPKTGMSERII